MGHVGGFVILYYFFELGVPGGPPPSPPPPPAATPQGTPRGPGAHPPPATDLRRPRAVDAQPWDFANRDHEISECENGQGDGGVKRHGFPA